MLKFYNVLNSELKKIFRKYGRGNMFLMEEITTVVKVGVSGLRA